MVKVNPLDLALEELKVFFNKRLHEFLNITSESLFKERIKRLIKDTRFEKILMLDRADSFEFLGRKYKTDGEMKIAGERIMVELKYIDKIGNADSSYGYLHAKSVLEVGRNKTGKEAVAVVVDNRDVDLDESELSLLGEQGIRFLIIQPYKNKVYLI